VVRGLEGWAVGEGVLEGGCGEMGVGGAAVAMLLYTLTELISALWRVNLM